MAQLLLHAVVGVVQQRGELLLEVVLAVGRADEVQHREALFPLGQAQAAPQLLEEDRQRFRGSQEQHRVHLGDVHALVVNIHHEQHPQLAPDQPLLGGGAHIVPTVAGQCQRWDAAAVEVIRHEPRVLDGHAEPQRPHVVHVSHIPVHAAQDVVGALLRHALAERVQVAQLRPVISAPHPAQVVQIHGVRHAEVLERAQQLAIDGLRQADLRRDAPVEILVDVLTVHALRRGGQAQQHPGLEVRQRLFIGLRRRMVGFVDDDIVVIIGGEPLIQCLGVQRLHRHEKVLQALRAIIPHEELAKVDVLQHAGEGRLALLQYLLTVGDEQQPVGLPGILFAKSPVIEGGDHGLARAGSGDDQVSGGAAHLAFGQQLVQDLLLIGIGPNVEQELGMLPVVVLGLERLHQPGPHVRAVELELVRVPIGIEGGGDLADRRGQVLRRDLHVPLQAAGNGGVGQVRRAHIGRREAGFAVEHIGLGVQARALGVVADLDTGIGQLGQLFHGLDVRRAHVGRGDDAQFPASPGERLQFLEDQPQAAPFDEGDQHVDAVGAGDLLLELGEHLRLVHRAGEQAALGDGGLRAHGVARRPAQRQRRVLLRQQRHQLLRTFVDALALRLRQQPDQPVRQCHLIRHVAPPLGHA